MPILSDFAKNKKINFFINGINKKAKVLEIGSGSGWLEDYMKKNGWLNYTGIDLNSPADIVGDIKNWKEIGLQEMSFDYIIAFEVVEHIDIFQECFDLLKNDGKLIITTPIPHMDWLLKFLENVGLNQKRTSSHSNLVYLEKTNLFKPIILKKMAALSQWAILEKVI